MNSLTPSWTTAPDAQSTTFRCSGCSASSRIMEPIPCGLRLAPTVENENRLLEHVLVVPTFLVGPQRDQVVPWLDPSAFLDQRQRDLGPLLHHGDDPGCVACGGPSGDVWPASIMTCSDQ